MGMPTTTSPLSSPSHSGLHGIHANVRAYGAVGDNTTDDSAAIQDALDSLKNVYIPAVPGGNAYKIGTPLVPHAGQVIYSDGGTSGYGGYAARLECLAPNTHIWEMPSLSETRFVNLTFEDRNYGVSTTGLDSAFYIPVTSTLSAVYWNNCHFIGLSYAFESVGDFLSNWFDHCFFFNSPSRFDLTTTGYFNNNHWSNCRFNTFRQNKPCIEVVNGDTGTARSLVMAGNYGTQSYAESIDRSFFKGDHMQKFAWDKTYFEAWCEDGTTYVGGDGITRTIPLFDFRNPSVAAGGQGTPNEIRLGPNDYTGDTGSGGNIFGCTNESGGINGRIDIMDRITHSTALADNGKGWHASAFQEVQFNKGYHRINPGNDTFFPDSISNLMHWDAFYGDFIRVSWRNTAGFTMQNPVNNALGAEVTFELFNNGAFAAAVITWASDWTLTGGALSSVANNKARQIHFAYNTDGSWVEQWRSAEYTP